MKIHLLVSVAIAAVVLGSVAYAAIPDSGGVYTACKLNATGTIRLIDPSLGSSSLLGHCVALESKITWNQQGQPGSPGKDGSSPTVAQLAAGDSHCPAGGAAITDGASHVAYVCNGATGAPGQDGAPFNGTFTSPNGKFTLTVADGGVSIVGPDSSVSLPAGGGIVVHAGELQTVADDSFTQVAHDASTTVGHDRVETIGNDASTSVGRDRTEVVANNQSITIGGNRTETVHKAAALTVDQSRTERVGFNDSLSVSGDRTEHVGGSLQAQAGASTSILGSLLTLGSTGGCQPAARVGDQVSSAVILTGSATVCIGG